MSQWYVHAQSGERYGPIEREELDRWVSEGRLTPRCQVWMEGWPEWRLAPEIFPQISAGQQQGQQQQQAQQHVQTPQQFQQTGTAAGSPYASPAASSHMGYSGGAQGYNRGAHLLPDRGTTILILGLLGLLVCAFFSIPAWIMGSSDLKEIDAGRRDPTGRGMTQAGMILGIIGCVLMMLGFGLIACGVIAGAA